MIRLGTPADLDDMAALEQRCFVDPWSRDALREDIESPVCTYIVAESGGRVVGYVGFWTILDEGSINNVAVSPEVRRQHVGSALMEETLRVGMEMGAASYTLEVRDSNQAAIGLYEKLGFRPVGRRKNYYTEVHEDAILMTLEWNEHRA